MAFPVTITPTDPADIDSPSLGAQEIRDLKQALIDLFNLPSGIPIAAAPAPAILQFFGTAVPAGGTVFLGRDDDAAELNVMMRCPIAGIIVAIWTQSSVAAGAGETHTYTVRLSIADTALVAVATGAGSAGRTSNASGAIAVTVGQQISVKLVTSAAAGVANHSVTIAIQPVPS